MGTNVSDTYYSNANLIVMLKTQFLFIADYKDGIFRELMENCLWDWRKKNRYVSRSTLENHKLYLENIHLE